MISYKTTDKSLEYWKFIYTCHVENTHKIEYFDKSISEWIEIDDDCIMNYGITDHWLEYDWRAIKL